MNLLNSHKPEQFMKQILSTPPARPLNSCRVADLLVGRRVVVYGCGDGLITFSVFVADKYGICPEVLLDSKFQEPTSLNGVPAMAPMHYQPSPEVCEHGVAVVTVGKKRFHAEIFDSLRHLGFKNIILASDIYEYHLSHAPKGFESIGFRFYQEHAESINEAFGLMADFRSQEVFVQVLQTHVAQMPVPINNDPLSHQYFPEDIALSKGVGRMVNCGSYDGDTVRQLNAKHGKIEALICFEPDASNFAQLSNYLTERVGLLANNVMAFPCGLWSCEKQLRFSSGQRINSSISDFGEVMVQCVALDHVIPDFNPTFINMDIEGAEPEALKGAASLIKRYQPDLAICVYHRPEHLWEIPIYLHELNPGYRFYLRNYTGFPAETVLYASV